MATEKKSEPMYYGWITGTVEDRVWLTGMGWKLGRYDVATRTYCDVSGPLSAWYKIERERKEHNVPRCYGLTQHKPTDAKTDQEVEESVETLFDGATSSKESPIGATAAEPSSVVEPVTPVIAPPAKKRRGRTPSPNKNFINKSLW